MFSVICKYLIIHDPGHNTAGNHHSSHILTLMVFNNLPRDKNASAIMSTSYISYIIIGRFLGKIILWVALVSKRSNIERSQCPNFKTNIGFAWMEISNRKYLLRWEIFFPKKFKNQYFFQWLEIYQEGKFPPSEHHWLNQNPPRPRLGWVKRSKSAG